MKKKRIVWIDYVKAFACFLVVLGHLLQSLQKSNIDNNLYITEFINWFIYLFHMPLFMCMSGFLYCKTKRDFSWENYKKFEKKKIINLLIPYITFYMLFIVINMIFGGSVNTKRGIEDVLNIFNNPMPPYWFLYALMSIFIIIPIIEKKLKYNKKKIFILLVVLKFVSILCNSNIYLLDSFMKYAIYFYLGAFIKETIENKKQIIKNILITSIYIVLSIVLYKNKEICNVKVLECIKILFAICGIYVSVNLFKSINNSKILDTFKEYTFQIYLTHTIFAAGIRIILIKLELTNYAIHFFIGLLVSIYIPVIMSIISKKIKYTEIFFYPIKTIEELKERKIENVREKA